MLKTKILNLIQGKNSKGFSRLVSSDPQLLDQVKSETKQYNPQSVNEMIYIIVHGVPPVCSYGNKRQFNTYDKGYRIGCVDKTCKCARDSQKAKIRKWNDELSVYSREEMKAKAKKTFIEHYGVDNPMKSDEVVQKMQQTSMDIYGVKTNIERQDVKDKCKATCLAHYGTEFPLQSNIVQQKVQQTTIDRYGGLMSHARSGAYEKYDGNPFASEEVKDKIKNTMIEKYGYIHALQSHIPPETINILETDELFRLAVTGLTIAEAALKLDVNETTIARRCTQYNCRDVLAVSTRSKWEYKLTQFLISNGLVEGLDFIRGDRTILGGKEVDFYFPKHNFAVEVGSVFWHSELNAGRDNKYHYSKWQGCNNSGIMLLQYWDYEMSTHWNVIESKILYLLGGIVTTIGARTVTDIRKVKLSDERSFLEQNHLQGFTNDRKLSLGAYIGDELVAVMTLAKRTTAWEITRYATKLNAVFVGLFSRLLKAAIKEINPINELQIWSLSDNRHGSGNVYAASDFKLVSESAASYHYTKNYHELLNKQRFTKDKIAKKFQVDITDKTEWQLMQELGYDRIWDAGKKKWSLTIPKKSENK